MMKRMGLSWLAAGGRMGKESCGEGEEICRGREGGSGVGQLWRGEGNGETAWRRKICRGRLKRKQNRKSNKETGGAALEEKKIRFFLGLGLFFFFCCKKCPPFCLAENEGYL
jgi:hypothetical protein